MTELREELARRLWAAAYQTGDPVPQDDSGHQPKWRRLADEVLRQMEWARRETYSAVESYLPDMPKSTLWTEDLPLTLAPPEWKP